MADEFHETNLGDVRAWSDAARAVSPCMNVGQLAAVQASAGIGYRSVERWFTTAGQRRNLVTRATIGVTRDELDDEPRNRLLLGESLAEGVERTDQTEGRTEVYHVHFGALADCWDYMLELYDGGVDPFLAAAWTRITIAPDPDCLSWQVTVEYSRQRGRAEGGSV